MTRKAPGIAPIGSAAARQDSHRDNRDGFGSMDVTLSPTRKHAMATTLLPFDHPGEPPDLGQLCRRLGLPRGAFDETCRSVSKRGATRFLWTASFWSRCDARYHGPVRALHLRAESV